MNFCDPCRNPRCRAKLKDPVANARAAFCCRGCECQAGRLQESAETLRARPTPQVTIEAILYCVRERGLAALKEPATVERLARCDAAAKAEIDQRIGRLGHV
jgi:hypothetical protein